MTKAKALAFTWEPLLAARDSGIDKLVKLHHAEVGRHKDEMPLDVDWAEYQRLEDMGILKLLLARKGERLIGYNSLTLLAGHLHYKSTPHIMCDAIYVLPLFRRTSAGVTLIDKAEADLARAISPKQGRFMYHDRCGVELLGPVLKRRGYEPADVGYDKMVRA